MGAIVGHQDFWVTGSRVYFQSDPRDIAGNGTLVEQPIIDLGRIDPVSPAQNVEMIQLKDSDGGIKRLVAEEVADITETYDVKCSNLSPTNLAMLFMALPPTALTQVAASEGPVSHYAIPGQLVKIRHTDGSFAFGLASITTVGALVEGTDYEVVSLERGLIRMIEGGAHAAAGNVAITYAKRAITGLRQFRPQTGATVRGTGLIVWGRKNNRAQTARVARFTLTAAGANFTDSAFSDMTLRMSVLNDITDVDNPAGQMKHWLGDLPSAS